MWVVGIDARCLIIQICIIYSLNAKDSSAAMTLHACSSMSNHICPVILDRSTVEDDVCISLIWRGENMLLDLLLQLFSVFVKMSKQCVLQTTVFIHKSYNIKYSVYLCLNTMYKLN